MEVRPTQAEQSCWQLHFTWGRYQNWPREQNLQCISPGYGISLSGLWKPWNWSVPCLSAVQRGCRRQSIRVRHEKCRRLCHYSCRSPLRSAHVWHNCLQSNKLPANHHVWICSVVLPRLPTSPHVAYQDLHKAGSFQFGHSPLWTIPLGKQPELLASGSLQILLLLGFWYALKHGGTCSKVQGFLQRRNKRQQEQHCDQLFEQRLRKHSHSHEAKRADQQVRFPALHLSRSHSAADTQVRNRPNQDATSICKAVWNRGQDLRRWHCFWESGRK